MLCAYVPSSAKHLTSVELQFAGSAPYPYVQYLISAMCQLRDI